jgi:hypothetical protein
VKTDLSRPPHGGRGPKGVSIVNEHCAPRQRGHLSIRTPARDRLSPLSIFPGTNQVQASPELPELSTERVQAPTRSISRSTRSEPRSTRLAKRSTYSMPRSTRSVPCSTCLAERSTRSVRRSTCSVEPSSRSFPKLPRSAEPSSLSSQASSPSDRHSASSAQRPHPLLRIRRGQAHSLPKLHLKTGSSLPRGLSQTRLHPPEAYTSPGGRFFENLIQPSPARGWPTLPGDLGRPQKRVPLLFLYPHLVELRVSLVSRHYGE